MPQLWLPVPDSGPEQLLCVINAGTAGSRVRAITVRIFRGPAWFKWMAASVKNDKIRLDADAVTFMSRWYCTSVSYTHLTLPTNREV